MPLLMLALLVALTAGPADTVQAGADGTIASARELYAAASYREALDLLAGVESADAPPALYEYRALCLVALGHRDEAAAAFAALVNHHPLYQPDLASLAPSVRELFVSARRRRLPAAAEARYRGARSAFDRGDYRAAADGFSQVVRMIGTLDGPALSPALGEMGVLADGFGRLAVQRLVLPATRGAWWAIPAPAPTVASGVPPLAQPAASTVVPPALVSRILPPWPDRLLVPLRSFVTMELSIDDEGTVRSARILESAHPVYDEMLIGAASTWRYRPALENGRAIPYRLTVRIDVEH